MIGLVKVGLEEWVASQSSEIPHSLNHANPLRREAPTVNNPDREVGVNDEINI